MEIKRNKVMNTAFLQTRGKENYKINLQTTLARINPLNTELSPICQ